MPLVNRHSSPLCAFVLLVLTVSSAHADSTRIFDENSPTWLRAVGKLHVPGVKYESGHQLNHREECSATLIAKPGSLSANTIVTAWHCLEFYKDLSKTITFTLLYGTDQSFSTEAYRLADGEGMHADWAILRLTEAVPSNRVVALTVFPEKNDRQRPIVMAGYSKNSPDGQLSYDPSCSLTTQLSGGKTESNCKALKGASGGAVVQLSLEGEAQLIGVISQGNGQDLSIFVPVAVFRPVIQASL